MLFDLPAASTKIEVFTTRPDTLFGATYMVLSPEHPLVDGITTEAQREAVETYKKQVGSKSDLERTELAKREDGRFYRGACHQSGQRRRDSGLDRGLCADGLRHGSDHGCACA